MSDRDLFALDDSKGTFATVFGHPSIGVLEGGLLFPM